MIPNDFLIISRKLEETISDGVNSSETFNDGLDRAEYITSEKETVGTKDANDSERETKEEEGNKPKRKMFSNFELALLRCCSTNKGRCQKHP